MDWVILVASGVLEAVWATALGRSNGLKRLAPTVIFIVAAILSLGGLGIALNTLPTGTAYAVWVGVGASLAIIWSFATGQEVLSLAKVFFLVMIVGGIIGLKVVN